MTNHTQLFYTNVITYPFPSSDAGSVNLLVTEAQEAMKIIIQSGLGCYKGALGMMSLNGLCEAEWAS